MSNVWRSCLIRNRAISRSHHLCISLQYIARSLFMLIIHKGGSTLRNMHIRQAIGLCVRCPDNQSTIIIIHLIHLSTPQIRRLLRFNLSIGDHFRGTCLWLLIEVVRGISQRPFVISGSIIASKAKRMRQRLFTLFHNAIRSETFFFFSNRFHTVKRRI